MNETTFIILSSILYGSVIYIEECLTFKEHSRLLMAPFSRKASKEFDIFIELKIKIRCLIAFLITFLVSGGIYVLWTDQFMDLLMESLKWNLKALRNIFQILTLNLILFSGYILSLIFHRE